MLDKIEKNLIGIVIGVRYRANFSIEDSLGEIVDKILYSKNSFFNPNIFPLVKNNVNEKILHNQNGNKLTINNSNIILDIVFDDVFRIEDYEKIISKFHKDIIEGVMKKYKITEINRLGLINRYLFPMKELAKSFVSKTIGGTLEGVNDINLTFSKKIPAPEAMVKKEIFDYHNVIFNVIKQSDKEELFISIDYQKYFDPFVTAVQDIKFNDFIKKVNGFNSKNYLTWLNKNYLN